jgi:hypothetical protein
VCFVSRSAHAEFDLQTISVVVSRQGEEAWPEDLGEGGQDRQARDTIGVASEIDCDEIRRQRQPSSGAAMHLN